MSGPDVCAHMIPADEPCAECLADYFNQLEARRTERDKAMRDLLEYLAHDSWRCGYYQECHCGLNDLTTKLGLDAVPFPEK